MVRQRHFRPRSPIPRDILLKDLENGLTLQEIGDKYDKMHTSGHSDVKSMREVFRLLQPKAIIPIHTDNPETFAKEFGDEWHIVLLNDGDSISPIRGT